MQPSNQLAVAVAVAVEGRPLRPLSVANDTKEDACVLAASKSRKGGGEGEQTCLPPEPARNKKIGAKEHENSSSLPVLCSWDL